MEGIPLFEALPEAQRRDLAAIARARSYRRGALLFVEGEPGTGFHVVRRGKVRVFKSAPDGKEQSLHVWGPGDPVGEVAALQGGSFPASAQALEDCRTVFIPRAGLLNLLRDNPEFGLQLMGLLAGRLRALTDLVEAVSLKEVPVRLASHLLLLDQGQGGAGRVNLGQSKLQLASLLGTAPETLSRILGRMGREGLIERKGTRLVVLRDLPALRDLAEGKRRLER